MPKKNFFSKFFLIIFLTIFFNLIFGQESNLYKSEITYVPYYDNDSQDTIYSAYYKHFLIVNINLEKFSDENYLESFSLFFNSKNYSISSIHVDKKKYSILKKILNYKVDFSIVSLNSTQNGLAYIILNFGLDAKTVFDEFKNSNLFNYVNYDWLIKL